MSITPPACILKNCSVRFVSFGVKRWMQQWCKQNMEVVCLSSPLTPLVSPDPASAFLFHPFILTPISSSSPLSLGHAKVWWRGKNWTNKKERIMVSLGSQCPGSELPIFIFQSIYTGFSLHPPPSPEASTSRRPPSRCRVHAGPYGDP